MPNDLYDRINNEEYAKYCARSDKEWKRVIGGEISETKYEKICKRRYDKYCNIVTRRYEQESVFEGESESTIRHRNSSPALDDDGDDADTCEPPPLITADESAKLLNCTRAALFAAIREGRIQPPNEDGLFDLDYIRKVPPARGKPKQRPRGQTVVPDNVYTSIWKF
jgi:hypothetical protein